MLGIAVYCAFNIDGLSQDVPASTNAVEKIEAPSPPPTEIRDSKYPKVVVPDFLKPPDYGSRTNATAREPISRKSILPGVIGFVAGFICLSWLVLLILKKRYS